MGAVKGAQVAHFLGNGRRHKLCVWRRVAQLSIDEVRCAQLLAQHGQIEQGDAPTEFIPGHEAVKEFEDNTGAAEDDPIA